MSSPPCTFNRKEAIRTGYRVVKIEPGIHTHPQAKPFSPFLASTTKLRGGRFPLIGQGKLCVSGDFPHSNGIREGHEASLWVGCDNDSSNSAKGQILHLSKSLP